MTYDDKIIKCFKDVCKMTKASGGGASPKEVTELMRKRGWLTELDTVLDIEKEMRRLRDVEGRL